MSLVCGSCLLLSDEVFEIKVYSVQILMKFMKTLHVVSFMTYLTRIVSTIMFLNELIIQINHDTCCTSEILIIIIIT